MAQTLHQKLLDEGFKPLEKLFDESPDIWINYGDNCHLGINNEGKRETLLDRPLSGFHIERGDDVLDACPTGYDPAEFKKRFVVYVR